jgi:hypothetical protein
MRVALRACDQPKDVVLGEGRPEELHPAEQDAERLAPARLPVSPLLVLFSLMGARLLRGFSGAARAHSRAVALWTLADARANADHARLSSERGLSQDERRRLTEGGIFPQAPETRGPHDPMGVSFEPTFVLRPSKAAAILGDERAAELIKRVRCCWCWCGWLLCWVFWGRAG